ncbi:MAG: hypothetical protein ACE5IG_05015, partial [Dehalococcoidia bacterium]
MHAIRVAGRPILGVVDYGLETGHESIASSHGGLCSDDRCLWLAWADSDASADTHTYADTDSHSHTDACTDANAYPRPYSDSYPN